MHLSSMFAFCAGPSMHFSTGQGCSLGLNSESACLVRLWSVLWLKAPFQSLIVKLTYFEFFYFLSVLLWYDHL